MAVVVVVLLLEMKRVMVGVENSEVWESLRYEKRQLKMKEPEVTVIWTVNGNYYGFETFG